MVSTTTLRRDEGPGRAAEAPASPAQQHAARFRPDVEGMRAVAVLLVVVFHAGWGTLSGGFIGVDVFFVLSGFLITGLLADEVRRSSRLSLLGFYARRIRRLLPLATVVLCTTAAVALLVVPALDRPAIAYDIRGAALWFANWHFAGSSTEYMADVDQSPVLHYWSLSVEEQFYVVWPLLVVLVAGHRSWRVTRNRLVVALSALAVGSLLLSGLTTGDGPWAYFGLHTRAWELAAGGLLALLGHHLLRLPQVVALLAGAGGLLLVLYAAVDLDRASRFPGWVAVLPVAGTLLLLAAGARTTGGVTALLSHPVMTYVGRLSYGWYLWHWPCLVFARQVWGTPADPDLGIPSRMGLAPTLTAVAGSFLLAALTFRLVEQPVRTSKVLASSRPLSLGLGSVLVATSLYAAVALHSSTEDAAAATTFDTTAATSGQATTAAEARLDDGKVPCFVDFDETRADRDCRFGARTSRTTVVLMGDSHAAHWFPAMLAVAQQQQWQLYFWAKPACGFADQRQYNRQLKGEYKTCAAWRENVMERIEELPDVDLVVLGRAYAQRSSALGTEGGTPPGGDRGARYWAEGAERTLDRLAKAAPRIVLLRDVPRPGGDVPSCLSKHGGDAGECSFPREGGIALDAPLYRAEVARFGDDPTIRYVDPTPWMCSGDPCPVVSKHGTVIFRDRHHLTASFAREVAPLLRRALVPLVRRS